MTEQNYWHIHYLECAQYTHLTVIELSRRNTQLYPTRPPVLCFQHQNSKLMNERTIIISTDGGEGALRSQVINKTAIDRNVIEQRGGLDKMGKYSWGSGEGETSADYS